MGKTDTKYSLFLGAQPSFIEGLSRLLDFSGVMSTHNVSSSSEEADVKALRHDWEVLKQDMQFAVKTVMGGREQNRAS